MACIATFMRHYCNYYTKAFVNKLHIHPPETFHLGPIANPCILHGVSLIRHVRPANVPMYHLWTETDCNLFSHPIRLARSSSA